MVMTTSFDVLSFYGVLLAGNKINPVTHGLLIFVVRAEVLTPVSGVGVGDRLQNWCNWVCRVEGVLRVKSELAVVIAGNVESILSRLRGLEITLEEITEGIVLIAKSFKRSVDGRRLGLLSIDQLGPGGSFVLSGIDLSSLDSEGSWLRSGCKRGSRLRSSGAYDLLVRG